MQRSAANVVNVLNASRNTDDPTIALLRDRAMAQHDAGNLEQAQQLYKWILEAAPSDADALHLYGIVAYELGQHVSAVKYITRAISISPTISRYYNNLGSAYRALRNLQTARHWIVHSIVLNPNSADAYYNLGAVANDCGNLDEAEQSFRRAVALRGDSALVNLSLGMVLRRSGRYTEALTYVEYALNLEPANTTARFVRDILSGTNADRAPDQYLTEKFDAQAENFENHLVKSLHYDIPWRLFELCENSLRADMRPKLRMLDIGCGTGLVGAAFSPYTCHLVGVDISSNMLAQARQKEIYQRLEHAELLSMMRGEPSEGYDLIAAADVFIYWGRLNEIFSVSGRLLCAGGLFVFSIESLDALLEPDAQQQQDYRLTTSGRFAHSFHYVCALAVANGFQVKATRLASARLEREVPVLAWLFVLEKMAGHSTSP